MGADVREPSRDQITVLGPGAHFKGDLVLEGIGKLLGSFEGTIRAEELHIGQGGSCKGAIEAATIVIDGTQQGDLTARECLQLASNAHVQGDITAADLVVAKGATFIGRCVVGPDALANAARLAGETKNGSARRVVPRAGDWLEAPVSVAPPPPPADWLGTRPWTGPAVAAET
jgi:cytoskeletal protein CcmA (bactofilin family)